MESAQPSIAVKLAVFAFGALSLTGAWIIVLLGGFFHAPAKFSSSVVFVSGPSAIIMATLQLTAGAISLMWLCRLRLKAAPAFLMSFGLAYGPPALYLALNLGRSA